MRGKEKRAAVFLALLLGSAAVLCFFYTGAPSSQALAEEKVASSASHPLPPAQERIDVVAAKAVTLRDPFAAARVAETIEAPQADKGTAAAPAENVHTQRKVPLSVPTKQAAPAKLVVSGIAIYGENRAAIFEYGTQHLVCRENETVGPYRVLAIAADGVQLQGPSGVVILQVGR